MSIALCWIVVSVWSVGEGATAMEHGGVFSSVAGQTSLEDDDDTANFPRFDPDTSVRQNSNGYNQGAHSFSREFTRRYIDYGDDENGNVFEEDDFDLASWASIDETEKILLRQQQPQHDDRRRPKARRNLQLVSGDRPREPLRIQFDTRAIESLRTGNNATTNSSLGTSNVDSKIDTIVNRILPHAAEKWAQHLSVRSVRSPFVVGPNECQFQYASLLTYDVEYTDADVVIVVAGEVRGDVENLCDGSTLAYARACDLDQVDRPIVGVITFCLDRDTTEDGFLIGTLPDNLLGINVAEFYQVYTGATLRATHLRLSLLEITIHELAHVLGMSFVLFPFFRDEDGVPLTERDAFGFPVASEKICSNGTVVVDNHPSERTVQTFPRAADEGSAGEPRWEQYLTTPRVQRVARNHFNCSTLLGGRLQEESYCIGSHWHERHWFGELLGPAVTEGSASLLSVLTLAFMEDTGWYQVDYRGAGNPGFGLAAGCDFVNEDCIDKTTQTVPEFAENEFCSTPFTVEKSTPTLDSLNSVVCDPSHQSWAICDLSTLRPVTETEITYFSDPTLSTIFFSRADNCPIPIFMLGLDCRVNDTYKAFYAGESVGETSRCVNAFRESEYGRAYQPACMSIECDMEASVVRIGQGEYVQNCTYDGEILNVTGRSDSSYVCPRLAILCPEIFACPDGCFGRGTCVYAEGNRSPPFCQCDDPTNTHISCAPEYITTSISTPSPSRITTMAPFSTPTELNTTAPSLAPNVTLTTATPTATNNITNSSLLSTAPVATNTLTNSSLSPTAPVDTNSTGSPVMIPAPQPASVSLRPVLQQPATSAPFAQPIKDQKATTTMSPVTIPAKNANPGTPFDEQSSTSRQQISLGIRWTLFIHVSSVLIILWYL